MRTAFYRHLSLSCFLLGLSVLGVPAEDHGEFLRQLRLPEDRQQVLLVTSPDWKSFRGTLQLYVRQDPTWRSESGAILVTLGRTGMGWGVGCFRLESQGSPEKVEGDGRSPAGIFDLGEAFGYSRRPPPGCRMPYRVATEHDYFVDDPNAKEYNSWVRLGPGDLPQKRWRSFEKMKLDSDAYELGIIVKHNMNPVIPRKGSAIFLHLWGGPDKPTAGCTAMARKHLLKLLQWLDPARHPLLIQLPQAALEKGGISFQP